LKKQKEIESWFDKRPAGGRDHQRISFLSVPALSVPALSVPASS